MKRSAVLAIIAPVNHPFETRAATVRERFSCLGSPPHTAPSRSQLDLFVAILHPPSSILVTSLPPHHRPRPRASGDRAIHRTLESKKAPPGRIFFKTGRTIECRCSPSLTRVAWEQVEGPADGIPRFAAWIATIVAEAHCFGRCDRSAQGGDMNVGHSLRENGRFMTCLMPDGFLAIPIACAQLHDDHRSSVCRYRRAPASQQRRGTTVQFSAPPVSTKTQT